MTSTDMQLLAQLKDGDATAFKKIYDRHALFLGLEAYVVLGCADSAAKAVKEVFAAFAGSPPNLTSGNSLENYLSDKIWQYCNRLKYTPQLSVEKQLDTALAIRQRIQLAIEAMQHKLLLLEEKSD